MHPANQHKIIVIETNQARRNYLRSIISGWGYLPFSFEKETICLDNLRPLNPSLVISGSLPVESIFRFITTLKMMNRNLPVLIISDDQAIQDFININGFAHVMIIRVTSEPFEIQEAITSIQTNMLKNKILRDSPFIVGQHPEILNIKKIIPEIAPYDETVLITGETGTGKELVAKAIHCSSDRRNNPFVKINTAELQRELFHVNLLGYGTQTMPVLHAYKQGKFERTNRGTVYLDQIDKIPFAQQAHLLHVLEEGGIEIFGTNTNQKIDVRIIASAGTDLDFLVKKGRFRKDLCYRLKTFFLEIPPLRKRIEDIPLLTDYFADKFCMEFGKSYYQLSARTKSIFSRYSWPQNVNELQNLIKKTVLLDNENRITDSLFSFDQKHQPNDFFDSHEDIYTHTGLDIKNYLMDISKRSLKDICREFIIRTETKFMQKALESTKWNRKKAASILNISYKSLLNKIKDYKLA